MMKKTCIFLAAGAALALSAGVSRSVMSEVKSGEKYVSEGNYFKCVLPVDWSKVDSMGQSAADKKVYGVDVVSAAGPEGIAPSISVKYYAKGNTLFRSAEQFMKINSKPIPGLGLEGEKYSSVTTIAVAGRKASKFERIYFDFARPRQVENKKISVFERYIVLRAGNGFYVLSYSCVVSEAKAKLPVFEGVVKSFEPLVR